MGQAREQIVTGLGQSPFHLLVDIDRPRPERLGGPLSDARLLEAAAGVHHLIGPELDLTEVVGRDAQHLGDHPKRHRRGGGLDEVELVHAVDRREGSLGVLTRLLP